jgi:hypothetical protein
MEELKRKEKGRKRSKRIYNGEMIVLRRENEGEMISNGGIKKEGGRRRRRRKRISNGEMIVLRRENEGKKDI